MRIPVELGHVVWVHPIRTILSIDYATIRTAYVKHTSNENGIRTLMETRVIRSIHGRIPAMRVIFPKEPDQTSSVKPGRMPSKSCRNTAYPLNEQHLIHLYFLIISVSVPHNRPASRQTSCPEFFSQVSWDAAKV